MSIEAQKFLENNNIKLEKGQFRLFDAKDINQIIENYSVYYNCDVKQVCIKDIVGYEYAWHKESNDLFESFNNYFNSEGDSYHSRANGMLNYSSSEIIEKIASSFIIEPINVTEFEDNKFVISTNGIHRFHILKVAYLGELAKCKTQEEIDYVNTRFTIPAKVEKIDYFKSYCSYLLNNFHKNANSSFWLRCDKKDPSLCVFDQKTNHFSFTDEELLEYVKSNLYNSVFDNYEIMYYSQKYPSFNDFINNRIKKNNQK